MLYIPFFYEKTEYISLLRCFSFYLTTIYHMQTCGQNLKGGLLLIGWHYAEEGKG
jgi:hypothetical protein